MLLEFQGTTQLYSLFSKQGLLYAQRILLIKAPVGKRIQIRLHKSDFFCDSACNWNGMEVFTRGFVNGGYRCSHSHISSFKWLFRFCCPEQYIDKVLESIDNGLSIRVFSSYGTPGVDADYRII